MNSNEQYEGIRSDFESVSLPLLRLQQLSGVFFVNDSQKWPEFKGISDFNDIYAYDVDLYRPLENIYCHGRELAAFMRSKLLSFNDPAQYSTLQKFVDSFENGWLYQADELREESRNAKEICVRLSHTPRAIKWMIDLFDKQIELLDDVRMAVDRLRTSELFRWETEVPHTPINSLNSKSMIIEQRKSLVRTNGEEASQPSDRPVVVLITVNEHETNALLDIFVGEGKCPKTVTISEVTYNFLGPHGGHDVYHAFSEMGTDGVGASAQCTRDAIDHLNPRAVIAVGIAFGVDETGQSIGQVLVSRKLQDYEHAKVNKSGQLIPRGDTVPSSPPLLKRFLAVDSNRKRVQLDWPTVQFGFILSGQKLVDNLDYRESLKANFANAIGGEMEGVGVYANAYTRKVDWIVVKAICDWAHDKSNVNKEEWQMIAAKNAATVVKAALDEGALYSSRFATISAATSGRERDSKFEANPLQIAFNLKDVDAWKTIEIVVTSDRTVYDVGVVIVDCDPPIHGVYCSPLRPVGGNGTTERVTVHSRVPQKFTLATCPQSHRDVLLLTVHPGSCRASGLKAVSSADFRLRQKFRLLATGRNATSQEVTLLLTKDHDEISIEKCAEIKD